jgi:formamidopyrimidine-DNA glycosylase
MPELPEVEIVRRNLIAWTRERTITKVATRGRHRGVESAFPSILGCRIDAVSRLGKYLLIHLGTQRLVIHLGMSGRLLSHDVEAYVAGPHDHVEISTDDGRLIAFQDHRRFGRVFVSQMDLSALPPLGPDAMHGNLTPARLNEVLSGRRGKLKAALLNQSVISGIGNMYACEILWSSRLAPDRSILTLHGADYEHLAHSISDVLRQAIGAGGATLEDYRGTSGAMGNFDLSFAVYGRHGRACPRCRSPISAETLMGRITYWCRGCQR